MGQPCPGPPHGFVGEGERGRAGPRALSRSLSTAAAAWEVCGQHGAPWSCVVPRRGDSGCQARSLPGSSGRSVCRSVPRARRAGRLRLLNFVPEVLEMFRGLSSSCYTLTAVSTAVFASPAGSSDAVRALKLYAGY